MSVGNPNFGNYAYVDPEAILDEKCPKPPAPTPPEPVTPTETSAPPSSLDKLQTVLDFVGFFPGPVGVVADVTNGVIHAARGNYKEAAWSLVGAVPGPGDWVSGARKVAKVAKVGEKTSLKLLRKIYQKNN